jgi:hypothetical protein
MPVHAFESIFKALCALNLEGTTHPQTPWLAPPHNPQETTLFKSNSLRGREEYAMASRRCLCQSIANASGRYTHLGCTGEATSNPVSLYCGPCVSPVLELRYPLPTRPFSKLTSPLLSLETNMLRRCRRIKERDRSEPCVWQGLNQT